jgi:outer membrane protein, heavy metal efflux system
MAAAPTPPPSSVAASRAAQAPVVRATHVQELLPPDRRVSAPTLSQRLRIPPAIPGAAAPQVLLPKSDPENPGFRYQIINLLFPSLPPVWPVALPRPTAERPALSLAQLQELALLYSPMIVQARADITSSLGDAIQARLHPNPTLGYEADTVGSVRTRNYHGIYLQQTVKTAGKLNLAGAARNVELMNTQLMLQRTRLEVLSDVKRNYFAVLVAQENVVVMSALARFTEVVFQIQKQKLEAGEGAGFEAAQLRGLAEYARTFEIQAKNAYVAAWKVLVAGLGLPQMPPTALIGRADMPVPAMRYDAALARMLSVHPNVLIGRNLPTQARLQLRFQQMIPVPDVNVYATVQRDFTTPSLPLTTYNLQMGLPLPIFDNNKGNIISAQGDLVRASQQMRRAQIELTAQLAEAFNRYETNRYWVQSYGQHILPDYARAYRGVYERHQAQPQTVGFEGIIVAQRNLADAVAVYITALNGQWTAVADLANLMQIENLGDMSAYGGGEQIAAPPGSPLPAAKEAEPTQPREGL